MAALVEKIARFYGASNMKVMNYGLKKEFLDRYNVDAVLKDNHLTAEQIAEDVLSIYNKIINSKYKRRLIFNRLFIKFQSL